MPDTPVSNRTLDHLLTAQLAVAWAGEGGEEPRLAWWRTDLVSEFGGEDLFRRLLPETWRWAVLQAAREAARRADAAARAGSHDPDRIVSIFHLGFTLDERLDERLAELKGAGRAPERALPGLGDLLSGPWRREDLIAWLQAFPAADASPAPVGRHLKGAPPESLEGRMDRLLAALLPLAPRYPLPHYRVTGPIQ